MPEKTYGNGRHYILPPIKGVKSLNYGSNMPMRVYLVYDSERHEYFIPDGSKVADIKAMAKNKFMLGQDDGKSDKKVVVLNYLGADLNDDWSFSDIGVLPGASIKVGEKEEKRPRLYIHCSFNKNTLKIMDNIEPLKITVGELRSIIASLVGLPVGVFRLATHDDKDLFDIHTLFDYDIEIGDTIHLHTWDGWTDFLTLCIMGYTAHVFAQLSEDELVSKYQMKVAMHIACHFGHIDLVLNLMKQGVRADDPVGYHPYRQWCNIDPHLDSVKPPIHECAEQGQMACLRSIVNHNITTISCKDGNEKSPFQVALRCKQRPCAGFLLGKQWSRIQYGPATLGITLPLNIYSRLKNWCERAKDRNYNRNGPSKSTLKRRPYINMGGTLVGLGVLVDGYSPSIMNGKSEEPNSRKQGRSFLLASDLKNPHPKQYFKTATKQLKGGLKSRAKIAEPPKTTSKSDLNQTGGAKTSRKDSRSFNCINEEEEIQGGRIQRDVTMSRLEQAAIDEIEYEKRMTTLRSTNSREGDVESNDATVRDNMRSTEPEDVRFPSIDGRKKEGQYIETGKDERAKSRTKSRAEDKKDRMVISAMKKAKVQTVEYSIPLPLINTENTTRPYLQHCKSKETDPALSTLALYEKYRGIKARDYAIKCLSIASNFKDKPWLQQVRLAMDLTSQEVRKKVRKTSAFNNKGKRKHTITSHSM